jgi:hypothetical protein
MAGLDDLYFVGEIQNRLVAGRFFRDRGGGVTTFAFLTAGREMAIPPEAHGLA